MAWRFRMRPSIGPFRLNIGRRGLSSVSLKLGPFTRNFRRNTTTVDLPGPFSWVFGGRARRNRTRR
jgi:hypothetical protein